MLPQDICHHVLQWSEMNAIHLTLHHERRKYTAKFASHHLRETLVFAKG